MSFSIQPINCMFSALSYFKMKFRLLIFPWLILAINACERDVIWQSDFCLQSNSLVNNTILPPIDSSCQFYIGDRLTLINTNTNLYENFYQVSTMDEMLACNATNAINTRPLIINRNQTSLNLVISNDFEFSVTRIVYLISTSSGDITSAQDDVIGSSPCLRMSFHLITSSSVDCSLSSQCLASVLNDSSILDLGCNFGTDAQTTQATLHTTTQATIQTTTRTTTQAIAQRTTTTANTASMSNPTPNGIFSPSITICLTFEYDFCFDAVFFPLFALIILVSLFIVLATLFICYLKHCLCFSFCHRNTVDPNVYNTSTSESFLKKTTSDQDNESNEDLVILNPDIILKETMDSDEQSEVQLTVVQPIETDGVREFFA